MQSFKVSSLLIVLIINSGLSHAQRSQSSSRRSSSSGRALGLNPQKSSASSNIQFDCPEEFGYFPHPSDCSLYYVCVFGGALLESCTGGLMYSHELQTCDWPRNVGCEVREIVAAPKPVKQSVPKVSTPSRVRYSQPQPTIESYSQEQQQQQQQRIQQQQQPPQQQQPSPFTAPARIKQVQPLPPPPQHYAPNPVITSRGQPKELINENAYRHQLYAAADDLPPVDEEENDRPQRLSRNQASTITQVQRDRDGLIQVQPNVNAIPVAQKGASYNYNAFSKVEQTSASPNDYSAPSKSLISQNKDYYNSSAVKNYNQQQYDPYYAVYEDDIYADIDYSNQYNHNNNQRPSTTSSTYRPITSVSPQTFATKATPTTIFTQAPKNYNSNSYDYDEALVSQLENGDRFSQQQFPANQDYRNRNRGNSAANVNTGNTQATVSPSSTRGGSQSARLRPTVNPSVKSKLLESAQQHTVDIYRHAPSRPDTLYPQPIPDKTAAKCRRDVCLLPDCFCGGKDIPGELPVEQVPQIVLLTFDDSVNDLNKQLYQDLFEKGRVNPNGCKISATFYVSHEWTDYSQVQNLYSDGHEMASHTVSHSFGEQFSLKKWAREIAGQREILSAYGGVKQSDIRGMRAPFLSIGGNKMFKMLHDFNFTYDSSMPVYENRPPSWPYTLDYKIFHDCMIPPCPTKSYPGVWEVPMVMWQDLNGGRCSMGDACSNPADSDGVSKMIMKNFERHYTTNRAPFGLFYHAAWFTQPHHKEGFIKFLDTINAMNDVFIITNWQALQWVRDPTPISRINSFLPFQCNHKDRPKRCNNPKVCNLWHKSGVRYMRTCQPCPEIYPWTGKSGIKSSRIDNDLEVVEST